MDKTTAINIAQQYMQLVYQKYAVKKSMLFGSFAKGNFNDDSDIDIAIVLTNPTDIIDAQIDMMKLRRSIDLRIEPHPFLLNDFSNLNPVANEIMKYGIELSA